MQVNLKCRTLDKPSLLPCRVQLAKCKCLCIYYLAPRKGAVKWICLSLPTQHWGQVQALWQLSSLEKEISSPAEQRTHTSNGPRHLAARCFDFILELLENRVFNTSIVVPFSLKVCLKDLIRLISLISGISLKTYYLRLMASKSELGI